VSPVCRLGFAALVLAASGFGSSSASPGSVGWSPRYHRVTMQLLQCVNDNVDPGLSSATCSNRPPQQI
jgi:hypothetical protein